MDLARSGSCLHMEFRAPDWDAPLDLAERMSGIPADHTVKGMFILQKCIIRHGFGLNRFRSYRRRVARILYRKIIFANGHNRALSAGERQRHGLGQGKNKKKRKGNEFQKSGRVFIGDSAVVHG